jgi:twinkle protein
VKNYWDFGIQLTSTRTDPAGNAYTTCPQCSPQRKNTAKRRIKCLSVNLHKEIWLCHHCGWAGTLKEGGKTRKIDTGLDLQQWALPSLPAEKKPLPANIVQWFEKRGIPAHVVARNNIQYRSTYMPQLESWSPVIWFPYYRDGQLVNVKYRHLDKHYKLHTGAERILYGIDDLKDQTTAIIVEGEMDKLSIEAAGWENCVSVPNGAPPMNARSIDNHLSFLKPEDFPHITHWIIAVDTDEPGQRLRDELRQRLGRDKCSVITWPTGCKDANDVLVNLGLEALITHIYDNMSLPPIEGAITVRDITRQAIQFYQEGMEPGALTGWNNVDDLYRVRLGQLNIVTGIPGHGKSEWLDALLVNLANLHGWSSVIFSPENHPLEMHLSKLLEKRLNKPFNKTLMTAMSLPEVQAGLNWLNNYFYFLKPTDDNQKLDTILSLTEQLITRHGIRCLVIDPWNELDHTRPESLNESEYVSRCLSKLRRFARKHRVAVFLVAHPTKLQKITKQVKSRHTGEMIDKSFYPVPTLYEISGSSHFFNKTDNGITVYRLAEPGEPVQIHIQKIKFKSDGKRGKALLDYDIYTGRYKDHVELIPGLS